MACKQNQEVDLSTFMDDDEYTLLASDEVEDPLDEYECWYIWEIKEKLKKKYSYPSSESGKWMFFVRNKFLHQMWRKACFLYRDGRLEGIELMKVSTSKPNPRSSSEEEGVIIFYCGPCSNQKLMLQYGMNLVRLFRHTSPFGSIPYKSDSQTYLGTKATGNKFNSIYTLPVARSRREYEQPREPVYWSSVFTARKRASEVSNWRARDVEPELPPRNQTFRGQTNSPGCVVTLASTTNALTDFALKIPSQTTDLLWLSEPEDFQYIKNGLHVDLGVWRMVFAKSNIDESWLKACHLFRKGALPDQVKNIKVTTRLRDYGRDTSLLSFFCEDTTDKESLKSIGTALVKVMDYKSERGYFSFNSHGRNIFSLDPATC